MVSLINKTILVTGASRRIGKEMALAIAREKGNVILHHNSSPKEAQQTSLEIERLGGVCEVVQADFSDPDKAIEIFSSILKKRNDLFGLVNNASIFQPLKF